MGTSKFTKEGAKDQPCGEIQEDSSGKSLERCLDEWYLGVIFPILLCCLADESDICHELCYGLILPIVHTAQYCSQVHWCFHL